MKKILIFVLLVFPVLNLHAKNRKPTATQQVMAYIQQWKDVARTEMLRTGIPASITLAQAIIESRAGGSVLAAKGNNFFGIKCHGWIGKTMLHDDDRKNECFRVYETPEQSFYDHSDFLVNRELYKSLFSLSMYDYKGWAYGLKRAGYATNPRYAKLLISCIEDYHLYRFDRYTERISFPVKNAIA